MMIVLVRVQLPSGRVERMNGIFIVLVVVMEVVVWYSDGTFDGSPVIEGK